MRFSRRFQVQRHQKVLLASLIALIAFSGCARNIVLHPMTDKDIRQDGEWICMTPNYVEEVMKARLRK